MRIEHDPAGPMPLNGRLFGALEALLCEYLAGKDPCPDLKPLHRLLAQDRRALDPLGPQQPADCDADLAERLRILRRCYGPLTEYKDSLQIEASLLAEIFTIHLPIAGFMARRAGEIRRKLGRGAVFGINGSQGSGKTTFTGLIQIILTQGLDLHSAAFSIDDVYKTHAARQAMAEAVHPLFAVRSVAGTHDIALATQTLHDLVYADADRQVPIPRFDKMAKGGAGDRLPETQWPRVCGPVDAVILEGWLVGARAQSPAELATPLNDRERRQDPQGIWRQTMNQLLATEYRELFDRLDDLVVIQVRSMQDVYRNRELQEQHLRRSLAEARRRGEDTGDRGAMSPSQVTAFIGLYERTTRHMLKTLPAEATLTLFVGEHHQVERIQVDWSRFRGI